MSMPEEKTINQTRNKKSISGPHLPGPYMFTLLLTWTAGCLDAISFIRFAVFPANMTGNTVLTGIGIGTGQIEHLLLSGVALLAYCLGVFLAAVVIKRDEKQYPWSGRFLATLIIETPALLSFAFLLLFPGPVTNTGSRVVLLIALSSLAMGMQSVNARHFGVAGIPTTYITGTITSTIIGITHWFRSIFMQNESKNEQKQDKDLQQIGFQSGVWLVYVIAAALAAVAETRLPAVAVFLPLVSSILVLLTAILYQLA
jgi:uncharacterized membrane protein YoaK (UPF0700 family)